MKEHVYGKTISRALNKSGLMEEQQKRKSFYFTVCKKQCNMLKEKLWKDTTSIKHFGLTIKFCEWEKTNAADHIEHDIPSFKHGGSSIMLSGCYSLAMTWKLLRVGSKRMELNEAIHKHTTGCKRQRQQCNINILLKDSRELERPLITQLHSNPINIHILDSYL